MATRYPGRHIGPYVLATVVALTILLHPASGGRCAAWAEELVQADMQAAGEATLADAANSTDTAHSVDTANSADTASQSDATNPPDAEDLLDGYDRLYDSSGTTASIEVTITTPRKTRTLKMRFWAEGEDKALMVIDAPPRDAGTATLKVDNNLWNYLPKISRTIRVPPSLMMGSWMGSDLTNDDIVRGSSYRDDYDAKSVVWSEDPPGWKVAMVAKPDVVGLWNAVEIVFDAKSHLPVRARFYDRKDRLSRTMLFDEVKTLGGRRVPTRLVITPEREEGRSTVFRYLDATFDAHIPEDTFSLSHLEHVH